MARKILIVDDEPLIVKGLKYSLEQDGYETDSAADGEEALNKFFAGRYDLVLLDPPYATDPQVIADFLGTLVAKGMLSDEAMQQLAEAQGPEFDRLFLEGMIEHHEGAVAMAEDVIRDGENEPTRELAETVVDSQKKEIDEMKKLLGA